MYIISGWNVACFFHGAGCIIHLYLCRPVNRQDCLCLDILLPDLWFIQMRPTNIFRLYSFFPANDLNFHMNSDFDKFLAY